MIVPPPTFATAISFARATVVLTFDDVVFAEAVAVCVDEAGLDAVEFDDAVCVVVFGVA